MNWKQYKLEASSQNSDSPEYIPTVDEIIYLYMAAKREAFSRDIIEHVAEQTGIPIADVRHNMPHTLQSMRRQGYIHRGPVDGIWRYGRQVEQSYSAHAGKRRISMVTVAARTNPNKTCIGFTFGTSGKLLVDVLGELLPPSRYYVSSAYKSGRFNVTCFDNYRDRRSTRVLCQSSGKLSESFTQMFHHSPAFYTYLSEIAECLDNKSGYEGWDKIRSNMSTYGTDYRLTSDEHDILVGLIDRECPKSAVRG